MVQHARQSNTNIAEVDAWDIDPTAPPTFLDGEAFEHFALMEPDRKWELYDGEPREKPGMSMQHNDVSLLLAYSLMNQIDRSRFRVKHDQPRVRRTNRRYLIPDVIVVPTALSRQFLNGPRRLEVYSEPLPFVAGIWSPSTGKYDVENKIPEYTLRGDLEIWRLHPYDRRVTVWRQLENGSYEPSEYDSGFVSVASLPGVVIDLAAIFDYD